MSVAALPDVLNGLPSCQRGTLRVPACRVCLGRRHLPRRSQRQSNVGSAGNNLGNYGGGGSDASWGCATDEHLCASSRPADGVTRLTLYQFVLQNMTGPPQVWPVD